MNPIDISPEEDAYQREIADPHLAAANLKDASECIAEFKNRMVDRGTFGDPSSFGKINEAR